MVLPTLQSYSAVKHLTNSETTIQTKQEIEAEKKIEKAPTRINSAQSKWLSPITGTLSDEALRDEQEKKEKHKSLDRRRGHLSEVLEAEKTKYQNEITSNRQSSQQPDDLSEPFNELHFDESDRYEEERQTDRQIRIAQLKIILQKQMNEIKQIEKESQLLKQEEDCLIKEQYQLDQCEVERKQREKPHVQPDQSRQLLRQHKAKLHKRAKEIQEQLEFDIKLLTSIVQGNEETRLKQSEQQHKFRRDALKLLKQFEQQMKLEKEKEQEFDIMYQDEAAKQWSHHDQQWNRENELRENSIQQLLDERQEQIQNRLQTLKIELQDAYERQRTLIGDMEQARKYNLIEKQKHEKEREENKYPPRTSILQQERTLPIEDDQPQQIDLLEQKPKTDTNVQPKFYGRRRVNWN